MGKIIDITEKLDFESNPAIQIKGKTFEVNAEAETVLKVMGLFGADGSLSPVDITKMFELIFDDKARKEIAKLKLNFKDFRTLVENAVDLITGEGETTRE